MIRVEQAWGCKSSFLNLGDGVGKTPPDSKVVFAFSFLCVNILMRNKKFTVNNFIGRVLTVK